MKIAIFGSTLYANVLSVLLAECGNMILRESLCDEEDLLLNDRMSKQIEQKRLVQFDHNYDFQHIDAVILCYSPSQIETAKEQLRVLSCKINNPECLFINGSTFGLNGTQELKQLLPNFEWIYLPDVIQEGNAINSFTNLQQIMIGAESNVARVKVKELLRPFFNKEQQFLFMPILDTELAKLSISGMLATRISYMNDIALMAEKLGVDIMNVKQGMSADSRIGASYLSPGVGFGGEHFSHDILTLSDEVSKKGIKSKLLQQVWQINEDQKEILFRKLWDYYQSDLKHKTVAIWGASFKENTPNIHNSPIHNMLKALWAQGVKVTLHDPEALSEMKEVYGEREDLIYCEDQYEAINDSDGLCIVTAWKQYFSPDYQYLLDHMKHPLILDGRNIYDPEYMKKYGFVYEGVGRS